MVRKALEKLYNGVCTVKVREEYEKDNGSTGFREGVLIENAPCRLSYKSITPTTNDGVASTTTQEIKLFIAPELNIPSGSKITITQNNITTDYARSSKAVTYTSHQEIVLELFDRWS